MPDTAPARTDRGDDRGISVALLVSALTAGHTMASMAQLVLPAIAPAVARDYGLDPSLIGYQISLVGIGMAVSLMGLGNLSHRLGGCRANQIGHGFVASGLLILLLPWVPFLIVGSLVLGAGYGMLTPAASYLLMRFTPPARRNFVFSLHQVSIPLGGILAALIAPIVTVVAGWRWSVILNAGLLFCVIALMQYRRKVWDDDRDPASPAVTRNPLAGAGLIWERRPLRLISLAGACFSWGQFCTTAFVVVACVQTLGMSLVMAGIVLTVVQVCNAVGRMFVGWVVDRVHDTARVLTWVAGAMMLGSVTALALSPTLPVPAVYALFALLGVASGCWPGVTLAEVGRLAPPGQVSLAISGTLLIVNIGKFVGPAVLANIYALTASYGVAFASLVIPSAIALWCLVAAREKHQ